MNSDDAVHLPETFNHGRKSGIGTSATPLKDVSIPVYRGVVVKAAVSNTGIVYVGNSANVTADSGDTTDGFELTSGESIEVEIDDPAKIFLIASTINQRVYWMAV